MSETRDFNFVEYNNEKRMSVKDMVFRAIVHLENATDMEISRYLDMERNYVTRARTDLIEEGLIKQTTSRTCGITGKYVQSYEVGREEDKKVKVLSSTQMDKIKRYILVANDFQKKEIRRWCNAEKV